MTLSGRCSYHIFTDNETKTQSLGNLPDKKFEYTYHQTRFTFFYVLITIKTHGFRKERLRVHHNSTFRLCNHLLAGLLETNLAILKCIVYTTGSQSL